MTSLSHSEKLDGCFAPVQSPFFRFDLLKAKIVIFLVKITQPRSLPLLVFLGVFLLQTAYVLGQLLEHILFELTFWLT